MSDPLQEKGKLQILDYLDIFKINYFNNGQILQYPGKSFQTIPDLWLGYQSVSMTKLAITYRAVTLSTFMYNKKTGHYIGAEKTSLLLQHTFRYEHRFSSITSINQGFCQHTHLCQKFPLLPNTDICIYTRTGKSRFPSS